MTTYRFFDERCRSWNLGMFDGASAAEALASSGRRADARRADSVYTVESAQRDLDAGAVLAVEVPVWHVGPTVDTTVPTRQEDRTMTSNLIVVVHGSALTSERPGDIDVVFAGDRAEAERVVRAWAVERFGARGATLSLDLHPTTGLSGVYEIGPREGELCDLVQLPKVPGRRAPHAILRGNPEVKVYERRNISSWLRSPLSVTEMHAQILAVGGWRVRLAIESDPADAPREDWRDYCDGPRAIRSAIAKMGAEQWAALRALDPELYGLIEDVLEHGTRYVPPATLDAIRRGTPGGGPFASLDVLLPGMSMNPSAERVVTTTHGRMWWTMEGFRRLISGRAPRADATQESVTVSTTDHLVTRDGEAGTVWGLRGGGEDVEVQLRMQGSDDLRWWSLCDLRPSPVLDDLMARRP